MIGIAQYGPTQIIVIRACLLGGWPAAGSCVRATTGVTSKMALITWSVSAWMPLWWIYQAAAAIRSSSPARLKPPGQSW